MQALAHHRGTQDVSAQPLEPFTRAGRDDVAGVQVEARPPRVAPRLAGLMRLLVVAPGSQPRHGQTAVVSKCAEAVPGRTPPQRREHRAQEDADDSAAEIVVPGESIVPFWNSSWTNAGRPSPSLRCPASARNISQCSCTIRYNSVSPGRRGSDRADDDATSARWASDVPHPEHRDPV
jgi:hypothetical protein